MVKFGKIISESDGSLDSFKERLKESFDAPVQEISSPKEEEIHGTDDVVKDDAYYLAMKNPKTGERYQIPMLNPTEVGFNAKYIAMMKLKEQDEAEFNRILDWS